MDASEGGEGACIEALCTEGDAGDAGSAVFAKRSALDRAGVRFERHLRIARQAQDPPHRLEQAADRRRRKQARRSPAEEDAAHLARGNLRRLGLEVALEAREI